MNHKKLKFHNPYTVFTVLFFVLCLIPSIGMIFFGPSDANANEIRPSLPSLISSDGTVNADFLSGLTDWFDSRFQLRPELSTAWAKLNAALFRTSVEDSVILGSDGWLYYADSLDDYTGVLLSDEIIHAAAKNLQDLYLRCEELGIDFVFTVAPNKNSLYPDHMPSVFKKGKYSSADADADSNVRRLYAELEELGVPYADLHAAFRDQEETLYFRTDSHWNARGAALAADTVLTSLGRDSAYFSADFVLSGEVHTGDLFEMLYPSSESPEYDQDYTPGFQFESVTSTRDGEAIRFSTRSSSGSGRLLCWRDSFGNSLYPYLAQSFSEADFSRENPYDPEKLRSGAYDTVIIEIVERNISWLA